MINLWLSSLILLHLTVPSSTFVRSAQLQRAPQRSLSSRLSSAIEPVVGGNKILDSKDDDWKESEISFQPQEGKQFDWFKSWYPLVPVEILDDEIPHRFQLLGMYVVVWKDAVIEGAATFSSKKERPKNARRVGGEWRAFLDECPHRKVPLSEGRVEDDGSLFCSYHGWRFDGKGDLVAIPQFFETDTALERVQANPKSRCNAFPVQVVDGILWVWPESGDNARLESALKPIPRFKIPEGVDESRLWKGPWNYRQLPYGADYFIENVVDGAHVSVR